MFSLAPTQEPALLANLVNLLPYAASSEESGGGFHAPSIMEFYPEIVAFEGTPFALNRIMLIRLLVLTLLVVVFALWTRKFQQANKTQNHVPGKFQLMGEISLNFVRKSIAHDQLGEKDVAQRLYFNPERLDESMGLVGWRRKFQGWQWYARLGRGQQRIANEGSTPARLAELELSSPIHGVSFFKIRAGQSETFGYYQQGNYGPGYVYRYVDAQWMVQLGR